MHRAKTLSMIFSFSLYFLLSTFYSFAKDTSSANYELAFIKAGSDVVATSSSSTLFTYFVVGDVFIVPPVLLGTEREIKFSYDDVLPRLASDIEYEIAEIGAKTHIGGFEIKAETWQKDNDPYFYWLIFTSPPTLIKGFSISLDGLPDEVIDTTSTSYQYPDDAIFDGKHTFYVIPSISEEVWGPPIGFAVWIDTTPPLITIQYPEAGAFIAEEVVEMSCKVVDAMSGLDLSILELLINDRSLAGDYNEEEGVLSYTIDAQDGENIILVKAEDITGNQAVKSWSFIKDGTPPVCAIVINNDDPITNSAFVVLKVTIVEELSGIKYMYLSNDGIFDTEMTSPLSFAPVIDGWVVKDPEVSGTKTVYARFEDNAGNISGTYSDTIDLVVTVPDTRIISAPPSLTQETSASFYYEASRQGCLFSYSLDGTEWSGWSTEDSVTLSGLTLGSHLFRVKAGFDINADDEISQDEEDPTPAQWSWTVREETLMERLQRTLFFRRQ